MIFVTGERENSLQTRLSPTPKGLTTFLSFWPITKSTPNRYTPRVPLRRKTLPRGKSLNTEPARDESPESLSPLPLHQLPPPPGDFTGRKKALEELVERVKFEGTSIVGLFGMGGIGKTALGLRLGEELITRYPDAQIYLNLRGPGGKPISSFRAMGHVIRAFDPAFAETCGLLAAPTVVSTWPL